MDKNGCTAITEKMPAANTGFASGGVTCKLGALCFYSSSVLVDSFVLRNPPERKARKRWASCKEKNHRNDIFRLLSTFAENNLKYE